MKCVEELKTMKQHRVERKYFKEVKIQRQNELYGFREGRTSAYSL